MFLTILITAISLVREREAGTLEQLLVTPMTSLEIVLGKILPFGVVAMGAIIASVFFSWLIFGVFPVGNVTLLLAITPIFLLIGLSMGLLISSLAHSSVDALERSILIMVPQLMLSDFLFPLSLMRMPFRAIGELFPITHYLRITRGVYMKGQGFSDLWLEVLILCAFLVLLVARVSRTITRSN